MKVIDILQVTILKILL